MMRQYIEQLINRDALSENQASAVCQLLCEDSNIAQSAAILTLMAAQGETADELCGFSEVMQQMMICVPYDQPAIDIVGTGGDGANTVNISTAASLVAASCGATVIKHGNRSSSSDCGSADFLEACGVELYTKPKQALACIKEAGYVFLHKPAYHPIAEKLKDLRIDLQIRTIFNLLGPILNPAKVSYLVLGVYTPKIMQLYADTLVQRHVEHAFVVHGNGLDELNCLGVNQAIEIINGKQVACEIDPKNYGFNYCTLDDLKGGPASLNVEILSAVLKGERDGPIANTIALNAGVALYTYGVTDSIEEGVSQALESLAVGKPYEKLQQVVRFFNNA